MCRPTYHLGPVAQNLPLMVNLPSMVTTMETLILIWLFSPVTRVVVIDDKVNINCTINGLSSLHWKCLYTHWYIVWKPMLYKHCYLIGYSYFTLLLIYCHRCSLSLCFILLTFNNYVNCYFVEYETIKSNLKKIKLKKGLVVCNGALVFKLGVC